MESELPQETTKSTPSTLPFSGTASPAGAVETAPAAPSSELSGAAVFGAIREQHALLLDKLFVVEDKANFSDPDAKAVFAAAAAFVRDTQQKGAILGLTRERREAQSFLSFWITTLHRYRSWLPTDITAVLESNYLLADYEPVGVLESVSTKVDSPYPGLRPYTLAEGDRFFGREEEVRRILLALSQGKNVVLTGKCGSGRTSLLEAGVCYALQVSVSEESVALRNRLGRILRIATPGDLLRLHAENAASPAVASAQNLDGRLQGEGILLLIDSLEDVLDATGEAQRREFWSRLKALVSGNRCQFLLTSASDEGKEADKKEAVAISEILDLMPLGMSDLRRAVAGPADAVGVAIGNDPRQREEILSRIVAELSVEADNLPLLQFYMNTLWQQRENGALHPSAEGQAGTRTLLQLLNTALDQFQDTVSETVLRRFIHIAAFRGRPELRSFSVDTAKFQNLKNDKLTRVFSALQNACLLCGVTHRSKTGEETTRYHLLHPLLLACGATPIERIIWSHRIIKLARVFGFGYTISVVVFVASLLLSASLSPAVGMKLVGTVFFAVLVLAVVSPLLVPWLLRFWLARMHSTSTSA